MKSENRPGNFVTKSLIDTERLHVLSHLLFAHNQQAAIYHALTRLAYQVLAVPVIILSLIAVDYQFFNSNIGLPETYTKRKPHISVAFWHDVATAKQPLLIADTHDNEFAKHRNIFEIPGLDIGSYLEVPLVLSSGTPLGLFCVIDQQPRQWAQVEVDIVQQLSEVLMLEFEMHIRVNLHNAERQTLSNLQANITRLIEAVDTEQRQECIFEQLKTRRTELNLL